jgi:hypothetical protein
VALVFVFFYYLFFVVEIHHHYLQVYSPFFFFSKIDTRFSVGNMVEGEGDSNKVVVDKDSTLVAACMVAEARQHDLDYYCLSYEYFFEAQAKPGAFQAYPP